MSPDNTLQLPSLVADRLRGAGVDRARLVVGLSGGVDSVVVLHAVLAARPRLAASLRALHVDHGLSPNAPAWAEFCANLCAAWGVGFDLVRVRLERAGGESLEAAAREARYDAFRACAADAVLVAHNQDDQAETVLLQLLRGAGVHGLSAMPVVRVLDPATGLKLVRPLLDVPRSGIVEYARAHELRWIDDETNDSRRFDRNFLRAEVLPQIAARFPAYRETLARAACNLGEARELSGELARIDCAQARVGGALAVDALERLGQARALNVVRWWLASEGVRMPARARLESGLQQLLHARPDAEPRLTLEGAELRRYRDRIYLRRRAQVSAGWRLEWHGEGELALPGHLGRLRLESGRGAGLSLERLRQHAVTVCARRGGERIRLRHGAPSRALRNLFQEAAVPPWERAELPMLFCGERLAWVPGIGMDCDFAALAGEPSVQPHWLRTAGC